MGGRFLVGRRMAGHFAPKAEESGVLPWHLSSFAWVQLALQPPLLWLPIITMPSTGPASARLPLSSYLITLLLSVAFIVSLSIHGHNLIDAARVAASPFCLPLLN